MSAMEHNPSHGHLALLASAGSGKTTRLCHRYIRLLADRNLGAAPENICALTFTRKAAGEIFDRIVECLCIGAAGGVGAAEMSGRLEMRGLDEREFARLLRSFLDDLHRAVIGTMDSFVVRLVRAFPIELGIPAEFRISEASDAEGMAMRRDILADVFAAPGPATGELLEAFKRATFGVEEKSFERFLNGVVAALHLLYRFCPDENKWGNVDLIWPVEEKKKQNVRDRRELAEQAERVQQWIESERKKGLDIRLQQKLPALAGALAAHGIAAPWSDELRGSAFDQLIKMRDALRAGKATIEFNRKPVCISGAAARAFGVLLDNLFAVEINRALEKTRGLRGLLELYDRAYDRISRESGRFSFTDLQCMLAPLDGSTGVLPIGRGRQEGRLFIDYRMDCRLNHWLIDEFQDTSDLQWAVFSNLVSELVQEDPAGRERSFFYVGDVKQSVYRWRGGNPGLFLDIPKQYNRAGEVIRLETISKTRRCAQPVIDAVNKVFTDLPRGDLPQGAVDAWNNVWSRHETLNKKAGGCALLLQHQGGDDPAEARYRLAAGVLNEIRPVERGIGVGILTRTNDACGKLVNVLRRECPGMRFTHEGKAGIAANELAQVILSLIRLAAHPGNKFARQHVLMSPLAAALEQADIGPENIAPILLTRIHEEGFRSFVTEWGRLLHDICPLNEYGRQCLGRLEKAAAEFDLSGSRSCDGFLQFIAAHEAHGGAARGSIRIMTVHQAKGLEFDMVILPELQHPTGMNMAKAEWTDKEMLYDGKPFSPGWILKSPKREIAGNDPVLSARLGEIDEAHCFDSLCVLYVAMTRAIHALYMITSPAKKTGVLRPADLLKLQLAGDREPDPDLPDTAIGNGQCSRLYSSGSGDDRWYESLHEKTAPERTAVQAAAVPVDFAGRKSGRRVLKRFEPSRREEFESKASDLFGPYRRDILDFGSAIHELFEKVEWLDPGGDAEAEAEEILGAWRRSVDCSDEVDRDVRTQFRACLKSGEARRALARPAGGARLWREKRFEVILDDRWISGVFDRVAIVRNDSGNPTSAAILDFKSDQGLRSGADVKKRAERHRPQMELYRRALSAILGLAPGRISTQLLFTAPAKVVRL